MSAMMALLATISSAVAAEPVKADVVIVGGRIHDGSGGAPVVGDVAIKGDRIVAVGAFEVAGNPKRVDATGCIVAPGFIDLHNHSDESITKEATRANPNYIRQGCTTIVTGNCGSGQVDVGEYFAALEKEGAGTNVIHLMPHGAIRKSVLGAVDRPPSDEELERMRQLVDAGMRAGAYGMTTGLIYVPGTYATTEELVEVAKVVARHGGIYGSHIRTEGTGVLGAIEEAIAIGERAGCPVHISHLKASGKKAWGLGNDICSLLEGVRKKGMRVTADQYPYAASSTSLSAMIIPTWAREGGKERLVERLDDEKDGPRLKKAMAENLAVRGGGSSLLVGACEKRPQWVGKNIAQIAKEEGRTPLDVSLEITRNGGAGMINFGMSDEDVRLITSRPFVATASDGSAKIVGKAKPHPRSYGTFARKIGEFAHRRGWLSVEQAIRSSTGLPADILGLEDRGYLKPGQVADVVVFDLDKLKDEATYQEPHRYSVGFKRVYLGGQVAVRDDVATGILAGRPIRHASPALGSGQ